MSGLPENEIVFALPKGALTLRGLFGMGPESYGRGRSDGMVFEVELRPADGPPSVLPQAVDSDECVLQHRQIATGQGAPVPLAPFAGVGAVAGTFGSVANQSSAKNIAHGAPLNDGRCGLWENVADTVDIHANTAAAVAARSEPRRTVAR